jgi:hypothetical protein
MRPPLSVVGRSVPFQRISEPGTKLVPVTAKVKACAPTGAQLGSRELIVGIGFVPLLIAKLTMLEVPPPGVGLVTVTAAVPADAIAAAGMAAVNCVELTNVAGVVPPKLTVEVTRKFVPLTVRVKPAAVPATALLGEIVAIVGVGFDPLDGGGCCSVWLVPPPLPARNPMFTIAEITSPLVSTR